MWLQALESPNIVPKIAILKREHMTRFGQIRYRKKPTISVEKQIHRNFLPRSEDRSLRKMTPKWQKKWKGTKFFTTHTFLSPSTHWKRKIETFLSLWCKTTYSKCIAVPNRYRWFSFSWDQVILFSLQSFNCQCRALLTSSIFGRNSHIQVKFPWRPKGELEFSFKCEIIEF